MGRPYNVGTFWPGLGLTPSKELHNLAVASPARPRANTSRLFIVGGAALAAVAFLFVIFLGSRGGVGGSAGGTTKVVVAARDIPFRTPLTKDDLKLADFPSSFATGDNYTSIDDVVGKQASNATGVAASNATGAVAEIPIKQGQPLTRNMLALSVDAVQLQPAYLPIPKGFVALTIPTGEQIGVAGFIQAGDYINILAAIQVSLFQANSQQGPPRAVTKTVFTNVHVLKVGPATGQVVTGGTSTTTSGSTGGVSSSLTVVLTQCDAEYLRWLQNNAQLSYTLGSYQDYKPQDTKPDPNCADATAAHGVGPQAIDKRWGFTQQQ
jgi:Flp pilus assembly protein CpaB